MVERCQTSHLPDPFDPTPVEQGIGVYFTSLIVGGIDFAIIEDRKFKTGPAGKIPQQGPRPDHIRNPENDPTGAIHLAGDQHLATFVQHGIDQHRDGPFAFVAPAIVNTVYRRWWHPLGEQPGKNKDPKNPLPFTGDYIDGFGNKITMHAYANIESEDKLRDGFGIVRFNKNDKSITFESWDRFADVTKRRAKQMPGWPRTIRQSGSGQNIVFTIDPLK